MKRLLVAGCLLLAMCGAEEPATQGVKFAGATVPFVAGDGGGGFVVSFVEGKEFKFATLRDGKWSAPKGIARNDALFVNRADFPSIAAEGRTLVASWSTRKEHGSVVHLMRSEDGGATWSPAKTPHPDQVSQFGFVSLLPSGDAIWLDGRRLKGGMEGAGDMRLYHAGFPYASGEAIDERVCDCCQTAMAMTSAGPVIAYRDRSADETRDIAIVRRTATGWTEPKALHADGWKIHGCPVNGPQLDARGARVVAAWFTAPGDKARVLAAFSNDAGATFSKPIVIDDAAPMGREDVVLLGDDAVVSWVDAKSVLRARRVGADGKLGAPVEIGAATGFPRIAVSKENVAAVWSAPDGAHFTTLERLDR